MSLFDDLRSDAGTEWEACTRHDVVEQLGAGTCRGGVDGWEQVTGQLPGPWADRGFSAGTALTARRSSPAG